MLRAKVACAAVSPRLYTLSFIKVQRYPPLRSLQSDFKDISNGVCHIRNTAIAKNNPVIGYNTTDILLRP